MHKMSDASWVFPALRRVREKVPHEIVKKFLMKKLKAVLGQRSDFSKGCSLPRDLLDHNRATYCAFEEVKLKFDVRVAQASLLATILDNPGDSYDVATAARLYPGIVIATSGRVQVHMQPKHGMVRCKLSAGPGSLSVDV